MKVHVYTVCRNEQVLIPYFLRHYTKFAHRVMIFDGGSTDRTLDIINSDTSGKVCLGQWKGIDGMDDIQFVEMANSVYPMSRNRADYVIWVDADEIIVPASGDMLEELVKCKELGIDAPFCQGYQMVADAPPSGPGQIYDEIRNGFADPAYSKPAIINPAIDAAWAVGKHSIAVISGSPFIAKTKGDGPWFKLLHYRFLGEDYLVSRSSRNYQRATPRNISNMFGWHCFPQNTGVYSKEWFRDVRSSAWDVVRADSGAPQSPSQL